MSYLMKKLLDTKLKEFKVKSINQEHEIGKISLSCFDDKRYVLDDGIRTLAYFHKDSVTSCKEIVIKKIVIKKIVIIEKNCDN